MVVSENFSIQQRWRIYVCNPPRVGIGSAPAGGRTGIATAIMIGGIVACSDSANPKSTSVQEVRLIKSRCWIYCGTWSQILLVVEEMDAGAAATSVINNGTVGIVTVTGGGSGYTTITYNHVSLGYLRSLLLQQLL